MAYSAVCFRACAQVRPTADRGPILLCIDTSGSMRGARETVAKALSLECMRAAKAQDRGCYVFAFAGPQEVPTFASPVASLVQWLMAEMYTSTRGPVVLTCVMFTCLRSAAVRCAWSVLVCLSTF